MFQIAKSIWVDFSCHMTFLSHDLSKDPTDLMGAIIGKIRISTKQSSSICLSTVAQTCGVLHWPARDLGIKSPQKQYLTCQKLESLSVDLVRFSGLECYTNLPEVRGSNPPKVIPRWSKAAKQLLMVSLFLVLSKAVMQSVMILIHLEGAIFLAWMGSMVTLTKIVCHRFQISVATCVKFLSIVPQSTTHYLGTHTEIVWNPPNTG